MTRVLRFLARRPFSASYAAALLVVAVLTSLVLSDGPKARAAWGTGYEPLLEQGHWWSPLTSVFLVDSAGELVLALLGALFVLGAAERLLGTLRVAGVFALTAVVGPVLGASVQSWGVRGGELWARGVSELEALDPFTPIAGCILAASGATGALLRRRIRVLTLSALIMLLLYSGQPSDLYRLLAGLVGLGIGMLARPAAPLGWRRSTDHEARTLLAAVVAIVAVGPVATVLARGRYGILAPLGLLLTGEAPAPADRLDRCVLHDITAQCVHGLTVAHPEGPGPLALSLLPLLTLLVAAYGMARGRRFAAWLAAAVSTGLGVLGLWFYSILPGSGRGGAWRWHSPHYWEIAVVLVVSVLVPLGVAGLVLSQLRRFPVHPDPSRTRRFLVTTAASLVGLSLAYLGLGLALRSEFRPTVTLGDLVADLPERFLPLAFLHAGAASVLPATPAAAALHGWIGPAFWLILIAGAVPCLASRARRPDQSERDRVRELLEAGGGGSLAFAATWGRNSVWVDETGTAAVAYRVVNEVALTTSEPIGPDPADPAQRAAAADAVRRFAAMCERRGWIPALYGIHDSWRAVADELGWQTVAVGEEAVLRPRTWSMSGKKWQDVRTSVRRAERLGIRAEWCAYSELPRLHALQLREISEQWVAEKGLPELGFTLGGVDELQDPAVRLLLAVDSDERVLAVTSWLPTYRDGVVIGWTLDLMRRRPDGPNGVMEFLIAEAATRLQTDPGIEFLSLSAAPLAGSQPDPGPGSGERILLALGRSLEPVYGFRSLFAFKRKFQPELHPLFLAHPDPLALPAVGVSLIRAYLPSLSLPAAVALVRRLGEPRPAPRRERAGVP